MNTVEELDHQHGDSHADALTIRGQLLARWGRLTVHWMQYSQEATPIHRAELRTFLIDAAPHAALMRSRLAEIIGEDAVAALVAS